MNSETLDQLLNSLPEDAVCLQVGEEEISVKTLIGSARNMAMQSRLPRCSRIALCGLSSVDLIRAIVAFDGVAEAMLLVPAAADEATRKLLIEAARCTHKLLPNALTPVKITASATDSCTDAARTCWLLATSGTTGTPKLVEHTLATLSFSAKRDLSRGGDFVWGLLYDPCRFAGIQVVLQALLSGSRLCIAEAQDLDTQIEDLLRGKVNALSATPSLWRKLLMNGRIAELPLRQITLGGEIADTMILAALKLIFPNARIIHIYASTEAGVAFAIKDGRAGFPSEWLDSKVGLVFLRVSDDGHLLIKSEFMPTGSEIMKRIDSDGYLDSLDLVRVNGDRVFFLGRDSGAINVGGNKVSPEEIEGHIREVEGVLEARVFGKKSSMMGQIVAAEIVPASGVDQKILRQNIQLHCRSVLQNWQIPNLISFVNDLKRTATGKIERLTQ